MAIYTFKQGVFSRLADSVDDLLKSRIVQWSSLEELFAQFRFDLHDDVAGVYDAFHRRAFESSQQKLQSWMPAIAWVFAVTTAHDGIDLILVEDSLPDYLGVLHQLQPLVERSKQRIAEVQAELGARP